MEGFTDDRPVLYEPQNIHAILGHVREIAKSGFARDLTVRELYDPSLPEVSGSRDGLIQIFLNLLKNAAEAVGLPGSGDEIAVTTAYRHGYSVTGPDGGRLRSEEHTSELQSLMRISYAVFCLKKKTNEIKKISDIKNTTVTR